jgi:hypothetical protein
MSDQLNPSTRAISPLFRRGSGHLRWLLAGHRQPQQHFLPLSPPGGNFAWAWNGITLHSLNEVINRARTNA